MEKGQGEGTDTLQTDNGFTRKEYIEREAFLTHYRNVYCINCDRRKGMRRGKMKFVYAIGDAPCRACDIGDMLDSVEDFPAADVRPVVLCRDCRYYNKQYFVTGKCYGTFCDILRRDCGKDFFCGMGEKREVEHD